MPLTTAFRAAAPARTLHAPADVDAPPAAARGRLRGAARHLLRLWWAGWQAHVRDILPGDYRK